MTNSMRLSIAVAVVATAAVAMTAPVARPSAAGNVVFQLVYNSDTRGYYRPCG